VLQLWAEDLPGHELDRPLRPGEDVMLQVRTTDAAGNPVAGSEITIDVLSGDGGLGGTRSTSYRTVCNVDGRGDVELSVDVYGSHDIHLQAAGETIQSDPLLLEVIGPPTTSVDFAPLASQYGDGYYVTPSTVISLSAVTGDLGGIQTIFVDVDTEDPPRPVNVYEGTFSLSDLGAECSTPGEHVLRFYAEETSGVTEAVQTVTLYTARDMTTERDITNRPNPFRAGEDETIILFNPTASGNVTITIYDLYGGIVTSSQMDVTAGDTEQFVWDGRNGKGRVVANGGYICRVHGNGMDLRRKIAVVK
jgi:hypothetical protein